MVTARFEPNPSVAHQVIEEVDVDNSGGLDFREFIKVLRLYREMEKQLCSTRFQEFDDDNSGTIDPSELMPLLESFGTNCAIGLTKQLSAKHYSNRL